MFQSDSMSDDTVSRIQYPWNFWRVWKYVLEILFILYPPPPPLVELLYDHPCINFINLN